MDYRPNNLWKELSVLGERGILDSADELGFKNRYIDLMHKISLRKEAKFSSKDKVLDFGCGPGRLTFWLSRLKIFEVIGVDIIPEMVGKAKERLSVTKSRSKIRFCVYDGHKIPFQDGFFDKIFSGVVLSFIIEDNVLKKTIMELNRVLKSGGLFFFIEHVSSREALENYQDKGYVYKILRTPDKYIKVLCEGGFKLKKYYPINAMKGPFYRKYVIPRKLHFWAQLIPLIGIKVDLFLTKRGIIPAEGYVDCIFIFEKL